PVSDIDWSSYIAALDDPSALTVEKLKADEVYAISQSNSSVRHDWTVYDCAYCEIAHSGKTFTLINGRWYQIDANFLAMVDSVVGGIRSASITLPGSSFNDEED